MPAAFVGHGSPMNALESNRYTERWRAFGRSLPVPRAVLAISAHWYIGTTAVTAMAMPRTIHDFGGFPQALSDVRYRAPGDPSLAAEVAALLRPRPVVLDDGWGLDHGTWSVLVHLFPAADVPVVQLSIDAGMTFDEHVALGAALAPLRARGVLILGSGNVVHNLGRIDWSSPDGAFDWARRFGDATHELLTERPGDAAGLRSHPDYPAAAPTPEHFIPLLHLAGLSDASGERAEAFVHGYAMGSLSMASYVIGSTLAPSG